MTLKDFRDEVVRETGASHVSVQSELENDGTFVHTAYIIKTMDSLCESFKSSSIQDVLNQIRAFYSIATVEPHDIEIEETRPEP